MVREGLHLTKLNNKEEFLHQPLTWNPLLLMANGQMLGERSKVAWGPFAIGPSFSLMEWRAFEAKSDLDQKIMLKEFRGGISMAKNAYEVVAGINSEDRVSTLGDWYGFFSQDGQIRAARYLGQNREWSQYLALPNGILMSSRGEKIVTEGCTMQRV